MGIFYCILIISSGLVMIIAPKWYYNITQSWKNKSNTEPSNAYIDSVKFAGFMFLTAGIILLIVSLYSK